MRGAELILRASLADEEQTILDRSRQGYAVVDMTGQGAGEDRCPKPGLERDNPKLGRGKTVAGGNSSRAGAHDHDVEIPSASHRNPVPFAPS